MSRPVQIDTTISEFTYTVAREAPLALKRLLPEKLFNAINTEKGAMRFAARSTLDQKRELFSYLGIDCYIVFADNRNGEIDDPRKIFKDIEKDDKPSDILTKLAKSNTFVSGNKEFCYLLGLTSQSVDTKGYIRNSELLRVGHHIKNFKNKISVHEHTEANEDKDAANFVIKSLHGALWTSERCKEITGVGMPALRLLIYYYLNRHTYVSHEKIINAFSGGISGRKILSGRRELSSNLLVQKHPTKNRQDYTITAKGILVVNQFRDKVIKSMDF